MYFLPIGSHLHSPLFQIYQKGNSTISALKLHISESDHGSKVTCRAENPLLPKATLEEIYALDVACELTLNMRNVNIFTT